MEFRIREVEPQDKTWIKEFLEKQWGSNFIVTRGMKYYYDKLEGFIAEIDGKKRGLLTYKMEDGEIEITSLDSLLEKRGIGTAIINKVIELARKKGITRIWLITTNDNIEAIKFYQKRGFRIIKVYPGAINESRKIKPSIPLTGNNGIPVKDEIELEMELNFEENWKEIKP